MQLCRLARHAGRMPARAQRALPRTRFENATTAITNARLFHHARSLAKASPQVALPRATPSQQFVEIKWPGHHAGSLESSSTGEAPATAKRDNLPNIWLRDNCRCSLCINQDTMQKDLDTFQIPKDIRANKIEETAEGLKIQWSDPDAHESFYPWDFLQFYLENDRRQPETVKLEKFGSAGPDSERLSYKDFCASGKELKGEEADHVVGRLTDLIARHGLVFIDDVPTTSGEPTQQLLEKIAFIRETHYGGFYDFIPNLAMADTAYTNIALPAHTDNTYFSDPAGLQAFHMLSHTAADGSSGGGGGADLGGQSLLVDGFRAAEILRREDPRAFDVLCTVRLPWHASGNKGITIAPHRRYPVLELADDAEGRELHRIRWNTADRGVVPFWQDATATTGRIEPEEWYDAARKFDEILRRKDVEFWVQLRPGTLLVFDNWRVLHGRAAFTGVRRMCGGYINRDDYISRWRNTNFSRQDIMDRIVG